MDVGPVELVLIVVIVAMLFGVGKLPEVFGAVGKGIREFRREMTPDSGKSPPTASQPAMPKPTSIQAATEAEKSPIMPEEENESSRS